MANSILLENSIYTNNSTILADIDDLYKNIKKLEKKKLSFLSQNSERELLNSLLKDINSLIENINTFYTADELFLTEDIINYINKHKLSKKAIISNSTDFNREIRANDTLIKAIALLLIMMQIDENRLDFANVYFSLNTNKSTLSIQMPKFIDYCPEQESILLNKETHKFIDKSKKFYGLYLFFINTIVQKLNGNVKIYTKNSSKYKIFITLPVKIETKIQQDSSVQNTLLTSLRKKVAIYSQSRYIAHKIQEYLDEYNFYIKILPYKKGKNPNLINYDLAIIDSELLNKELINLISTTNDMKIILIKDREKPKSSFNSIADKCLNMPFNKSELTFSILELFNREIKSDKSENRQLDKDIKKKKVIIADSNLANLKLLEYIISQYNIDIYTTTDGKELINLLEKYGADLIITDSNLSTIDAYETTKFIRKKKKYNHIPIVIHSSFSFNNHSISNIFLAGFDAYLPKPFSSKNINNILKRYLSIDEKSNKKSSIKEFLALYRDIDILIEKYTNENKINSLKSLLIQLKEELSKLNQQNLVSDIDKIIHSITTTSTLDKLLIGNFINKFRSYTFSITN